jgi:hypothetical protein
MRGKTKGKHVSDIPQTAKRAFDEYAVWDLARRPCYLLRGLRLFLCFCDQLFSLDTFRAQPPGMRTVNLK